MALSRPGAGNDEAYQSKGLGRHHQRGSLNAELGRGAPGKIPGQRPCGTQTDTETE